MLNRLGLHFMFLISLLSCLNALAIDKQHIDDSNKNKFVIFYISYGYKVNNTWNIPLRLWVYEEADYKRQGFAKLVRKYLAYEAGIEELSDPEKIIFKQHGFKKS